MWSTNKVVVVVVNYSPLFEVFEKGTCAEVWS